MKVPLLLQYQSPCPWPIHRSLIFWTLLTSEKHQPINLLDFPCCQDSEITVHPLFYLSSSSCLLTFLPHEKLFQLATIPIIPLLVPISLLCLSVLGYSQFFHWKRKAAVSNKRSCYDICIKDIKQHFISRKRKMLVWLLKMQHYWRHLWYKFTYSSGSFMNSFSYRIISTLPGVFVFIVRSMNKYHRCFLI